MIRATHQIGEKERIKKNLFFMNRLKKLSKK